MLYIGEHGSVRLSGRAGAATAAATKVLLAWHEVDGQPQTWGPLGVTALWAFQPIYRHCCCAFLQT